MRKAREYGRLNIHVEINVTYRCNLKCQWCNRLKDEIEIPDSDMTVEQVERWCERMAASPWRAKRIKISGGEPRVNPQLPAICEVLLKHHPELVGGIGVCTNASRSETMPKLPGDIGWRKSPPAKKLVVGLNHVPPLVSPSDLLCKATYPYERCATIKHCGASVDAWGFTACSLMPILGRSLAINTYSAEPTRTPDARICDNCIFSLSWEVREGIRHSVEIGLIPNPTPTYAKFRENVKASESWKKLI